MRPARAQRPSSLIRRVVEAYLPVKSAGRQPRAIGREGDAVDTRGVPAAGRRVVRLEDQAVAQQDLAVSLYVPGSNVRPSQHNGAVVTSYRSADGSGDIASEENRTAFTATTTSMWWLKAIDVESVSSAGAIVAFGDSITDGTCTTPDAHDRWEDVLSVRLGLEYEAGARGGRSQARGLEAVVNEGIGGNTLIFRQSRDPSDRPRSTAPVLTLSSSRMPLSHASGMSATSSLPSINLRSRS